MDIVSQKELATTSVREIGAKAYHLLALANQGYRVPRLVVVSARVFEIHVTVELQALRTGQATEKIKGLDLATKFMARLESFLDYSKTYAVRSSAVGEDGAEHSFAGQLDSFLNVPPQHVSEKIKDVWASSFSKRAMAYRASRGIDENQIRVAVVIQEMVEADASGVAFGINPVTGNRREIVISAVYGLGEGLVTGTLDADSFHVCDASITSDIVRKDKAVVFNPQAGAETILVNVDIEKQTKPAISEELVSQIAQITRDISDFYERPQDIEWATKGNDLYVLQSRPVTTLASLTDREQQHRIWDNSNIIESYPGITTPLTFSFVQDVYTHVYQQFCRIMGVEKEVIQANRPAFQMLGFIKGRIYYNLLNWYKILSLMPSYSINAGFMEQMMGTTERIEFPPTVVQSKKNKYYRLAKLLYLMVHNLITLKRKVRAFFILLAATLKPYESDLLSAETVDGLVDHYHKLESGLLTHWQAPLINDFFAMIFFGLLKKFMEKWKIDATGSLQNNLLTGEGGIISTEPVQSLQTLSNRILKEPELKALFATKSAEDVLRALDKYPALKKGFEDHRSRFGDRVAGELKMETVTAKHDPGIIVRSLQGYIQSGVQDLATGNQREQTIRAEAEQVVRQRLAWRPLKRLFFSFILKRARSLIKNRENLRFERTRVYATVREIFLNIGSRFYSEGILEHKRDIFFLTRDEIFNFVSGTAVAQHLKQLVRDRKEQFALFKEERLPDRFESWGPVYHANSFEPATPGSAGEGDSLQGVGCSPGTVEGKLVVVTDPDNVTGLKGNILVAERTDPGWVPLFPMATGILVARGSLLSHSAIVAREMGIPAIVGIAGLMQRVQTDDRVRFDGASGRIDILNRAGEQ